MVTATFTATFTATPTVFVPITGDGITFVGICTNDPNTLSWQVSNANSAPISFVWWVVGGSASGGPLAVPANGTITFTTPMDGPLPSTVAIMWIDTTDGSAKSLSTSNAGVLCGQAPTATPTPTATSGVLIPVTGIDLPAIFRDSMFLNLGIGVFGFALILLGIGIKLDRDRTGNDDDDEEYEEDED
ncbi:MAG: hypothetical protein WEA61_01645 [Anaerolineales bacterium]